MQDVITKEIIIKSDAEKVYNTMTDPKLITTWFPDEIEGDFSVGQQPVMIFSEEKHRSRIYIESAKPNEYFSYRWVPGGEGVDNIDVLTVPTTLVEFFIEETPEGTKVTIKESGFASLPAEVAEKSFTQNSGGWTYMIGRLEEVLNK